MKIVKVVLLFLFFGITLNAQFVLIKSYGVKAAYVSSEQKWNDNTKEIKNRNGFMLGGYGEFFDFQGLSLLIQAEYSQKGFRTDVVFYDFPRENDTSTVLSEARLDYFSIPVILKYSLPIDFDLVPYVFVGGSINFLLSQISTFDWFKPTYENMESSVYGCLAGLGVILGPQDKVSLLVEFRYNFDIKDSHKNPEIELKNHSFEFLLGIAFNSMVLL